MTQHIISEDDIKAFEKDGCVCLRGIFADAVKGLAQGIETNMAEPGEYATINNVTGDGTGQFFDDYCNWQRIPEFRDVILNSSAAHIASQIMRSRTAQVFHDHILVKEPGTSLETPWHQDLPYYFTDGLQTVSFWIPIDPVNENTLRFIAGSHLWEKPVLPVKWKTNESFYEGSDDYIPVPNPDLEPEKYNVLEWEMTPGDAVLFDFRTVHGARANLSNNRRRAFSMRWVGDDVRFITRAGKTSPPFPGHGMKDGDRLREDWFPVVYKKD